MKPFGKLNNAMKFVVNFILLTLLGVVGLSGCKDNPSPTGSACSTFTSEDSVCYCTKNSGDINCLTVTSTLLSSNVPVDVSGAYWISLFVIGDSAYVVNRNDPFTTYKYDLINGGDWVETDDFGSDGARMTRGYNGYGYGAGISANEFRLYDPATGKWSDLDDAPFSYGGKSWGYYEGKFYTPTSDGIHEYDPVNKSWKKVSDETGVIGGQSFVVGSYLYSYESNQHKFSKYGIEDGSYVIIEQPECLPFSVFYSPMVMGNKAHFIIDGDILSYDVITGKCDVFDRNIVGYPDAVAVVGNVYYVYDFGKLFKVTFGDN